MIEGYRERECWMERDYLRKRRRVLVSLVDSLLGLLGAFGPGVPKQPCTDLTPGASA